MLTHSLQSVMRWLRRLRSALLVSIILCAILATGCERRQAPSLTLPARDGTFDPVAAQAVVDQLANLAPGETVTIQVTEGAANALVAPYLAGTPIDGPTLWFEPEGILVRALVAWRGDRIVLASASVSTDAGQFHIELDTLLVDGIPIPRWIRASLAHAASDALSDATLPVDIERITTQEGVLVVVTKR